jgi:hypothetical protein
LARNRNSKQTKTRLERIMKKPTLRLCLASLLSLILLACHAAYGQLTPSGDAYTNTAAMTTNYGAKTLLDVESTQTTFIQFNLESIPSGYTSADITKATLKVYVNTVTKAGSFNVDYVNGTWTENTIDASNAPALGTTIAASVPLTTADKSQYILVDVTAAVQAWLSGTANDGIALVANSPLSATIDSKESTTTSHPPELDMVFAGGGGSGITGIETAAGSGLIGGGTSGTLNLSLTNTCAAKQVLQWTGSAWACASAGTGTITGVTAGTDLTGGGTSGNVTLSLNTAATNALYAQLGAANTFATNQTVNGTFTASSSSNSILGVSTSASGTGVAGLNSATTGAGAIGVLGQTASTSGGVALVGQTVGEDYYYFANGAIGTEGGTNSPGGVGVWGLNTASTGPAVGVYGTSSSTAGAGVLGSDGATTGTTFGVNGTTASSAGYGVYGQATSSTGLTYGVYGISDSDAGFGVFGTSDYLGVVGEAGATGISTAGLPYGVVGLGPTVGVYGASSGPSATGGQIIHGNGVWGDYGGADGTGVLGTADDSFAGLFANNGTNFSTLYLFNETTTAGGEVFYAQMTALADSAAIIGDPGCAESNGNVGLQLGQTGMSGCTNYTLLGNNVGDTYLNAVTGQTLHLRIANSDVVKVATGSVSITGTLSATGTKNFRIDHPLDPANKYLTHAAIESSEVLNLYSGNATLDDSGAAVVQLPDWFEAINKDFRYQLTPIGAPGRDLYVAEEVSGGHFKIAGGKAGGKVSWQVTGVRNDAWEKAYPMVVEVDKGADRGHYLTPELYGRPASERIGYEAVPEGQQIVHHQRPNMLRGNASPAKTITLPAPPRLVMPKAARLPSVVPLPHTTAQASKPEVNQK